MIKIFVLTASFGVQEQATVPVESSPFPSFSSGSKDKDPHAFCRLKGKQLERASNLFIFIIVLSVLTSTTLPSLSSSFFSVWG